MTACPCGSGLAASQCCTPIIQGERSAATAASLMRARYSAYVQHNIEFIMASTHPDGRSDSDEAAMRAWAEQADWQGLELVRTEAGQEDDNKGVVEFIARFNMGGVAQHHHEVSDFVRQDGQWYFRDGRTLHSGPSEKPKPVVNEAKLGRNDPCLCGSGKKYKKCCGA